VAQAVEHLSSKHEALGLNPNTCIYIYIYIYSHVGGNINSAATMEISRKVFKKLKIEEPNDPDTIVVIHPKESKSVYNQDSCTPMFTAAIFTIAKLLNHCRY
jgi:hypothetical protein